MNIILKIVFTLITAVVFVTCKKYPENNLWFKNPENIAMLNGYITSYKVDGIDSLDLLNFYYAPIMPNSYNPYNKTDRNIRNEYFQACCEEYSYWQVSTDLYGVGNLHYRLSSDKKTITISGKPDLFYFKKPLFIDHTGGISWQIIYLDKKGRKSKIKTTYNDHTYEITFEH